MRRSSSALVAWRRPRPRPRRRKALLAEADDDPEDLAALDAVWEEAQVTFGPDPNAGCPVSRDILAKMDMPLSPAPRAAGAGAAEQGGPKPCLTSTS
jgi:nitrate reductase molybdenum cofactor assembly chaperone NarJ/NarW